MFNPNLIQEYLSRSAGMDPDKIALISGEERWTYRDVDRASTRLAGRLMTMGVRRRDRVVIFLENSSESIISLYGVLKAGGVFVMLDSSMKAGKLKYILADSGAETIITHTAKSQLVHDALAELGRPCRTVWAGGQPPLQDLREGRTFFWDDLVSPEPAPGEEGGNGSARHRVRCIDIDLATLIYTSGSTGEPKGVMSSHRNIIAAAQSIIRYLENRKDDIIMSVLPLSFDYGLYQVLMTFMFGGTVIVEKSFAYPGAVLERIQQERVTGFPLVPTMAAFLLRLQNLNRYDLSTLRYVTNTAAALPVEHIRKLRSLLPHVRLYSMYGLTECKRVSYLPPEELDRRPASVGKAIPNTEVLIVNEQGEEVGPDEVGELVVRGSHVMCGYWNSPELTSRTFRPGRFPGEYLLYSGDLFKKDEDGFLYFVGRRDDLIKTKGERVSPREVENVLCEIAGIEEAAVFGMPDELLGQAIIACIVPGKIAAPAARDIMKYCSGKLQPFMVPRHIEFVENLPKSPNGKVDKKTLKQEYERRMQEKGADDAHTVRVPVYEGDAQALPGFAPPAGLGM